MSIDEARALLAQQGHSLLEDPPIFSDQVRAGTIAEQDPPAGTSLGVGNSLYIKVSRGSADDTLSNLSLEGQSVELARSRLTDLGLRVEQRDQGSRTVPTGAVIGVESTASASAGDKVTLIVSIGDKVQVPTDAFSASVDAASAKLDSTGLTVTDQIPVSRSTIERQIDLEQMDITPGDVVGVQNADGSANFGAWLERGDLVTLVYYDPSLD
jgi:beta-lactam-binding protein with PASTA domain